MNFKIDKNITPINYRKSIDFPFPEMSVGDSFFVPWDIASTARNKAYQWGKYNGQQFLTRKLTENDVFGVRLWRIL